MEGLSWITHLGPYKWKKEAGELEPEKESRAAEVAVIGMGSSI